MHFFLQRGAQASRQALVHGFFKAPDAGFEPAAQGDCPVCLAPVLRADEITVCPICGAAHHWQCWQRQGGCLRCAAAPAMGSFAVPKSDVLQISEDQLDQALPLRVRTAPAPAPRPPRPAPVPERTSRLAVAALVTGIAGIPLFGLVTGMVAIVLGCLALASKRGASRRGAGLAAGGILLGTIDVVGWIMMLAFLYTGGGPAGELSDFQPDPAALDDLAPHLKRAMQANVLIESHDGSGPLHGTGIGSGVIVEISGGTALVVTNRHVIDPDFDDEAAGDAAIVPPAGHFEIKLIGQPSAAGRVLWIAPQGIDLALVSVPVLNAAAQSAVWDSARKLHIGASVFAIGNPHGLEWTHTQGAISQFRTQRRGQKQVRIIQTSAAINPGNSGGGLYDELGNLIGINTWTQDKRFSEGLGFAIAFETLLQLNPPIPRIETADAAAKTP